MAATYSSLVGLAIGGKYEIRRVLGIGGMGVVCEAVNIDLHKRVALKLIDKTMKESELIVERFRREARAAGSIQSEHIVDVFDMGADKRVGLYMVMEHLTGEDLQTRLERDKRLDVSTAMMIGHQIARGLAKAHAAGVIHRDLKPANVFLTSRDNGALLVKLLDFGVSKLLADDGSARITGSGAPIGTPLYMSPEQAEGKNDVDGRADIWSLGAVLYEALSGEPPFADRGSYHGTIVGILTSRPRLLKSVAPHVPAEICSVVDAMLVHDRDARIRDADTVTKRLLEAYPAVLPDGTGRHTAVIVSQAAATIDATGDTEIFTSAGLARPTPTPTDATKTYPDPPRAPAPDLSTTQESTEVSGITTRPRTEPIPPPDLSSSSAGGVSMPATPPIIEPLPMSRAPDTERDIRIAVRADRRRYLVVSAIFGTLVLFSFVGFYLGRHASRPDVIATDSTLGTTPATATETPPVAVSATAATPVTAATATGLSENAATNTAPPTPTNETPDVPSISPGYLPNAPASATAKPTLRPTVKAKRRHVVVADEPPAAATVSPHAPAAPTDAPAAPKETPPPSEAPSAPSEGEQP